MMPLNEDYKNQISTGKTNLRSGLLLAATILSLAFLLFFPHLQKFFIPLPSSAFAQNNTIQDPTTSSDSIGSGDDLTSGNVGVGSTNPSPNVVHTIHVSYPAAKDVTVSYPVQSEVCLVSASPPPNEMIGDCPRIGSITWSIKKVLNPGKSSAELQNITLEAGSMSFTLTLRPRTGVKDVYIVSQALVTLDPISGGSSGTDTSGSVDTGTGSSTGAGCTKIGNPSGNDWAQINSLNQLFLQKVNEVTATVGPCVPINLIKALVYEESGGGMLGENGAGYSGIMQVGSGSWCDHGKYDITTAPGNVGCGIEHLAHTYQECNNSWGGAVTAYYSGHCIPNGAHDEVADGGSGETDFQYRDKVIGRWHEIDAL